MLRKVLDLFVSGDSFTDPVCGMTVSPAKPHGGNHEYKGEIYYFCGPGCRVAFSKEPDPYLSGEKKIEM
tara:strand:- start:104 stop:310 length:207 start_codon:yes stop_codon:yes gene_type:complete